MKVLSLFSGIGAFEKALKNIGKDFELVNYCEIDKYASNAYSQIHHVSEDLNLWDVTKVDTSKMQDIDLVTYGFPCVPRGYKIKTDNGYKNIEDIKVNDLVLTHTNTYHHVLKTMNRFSDHINHIKCVGCEDLQLTDEHPLYVLRNNEFCWIKAKDLNKLDYITYNINTNSIKTDIPDNALWLLGRYIADGYKEKNTPNRPVFAIGKAKVEEFEQHIKDYSYTVFHADRSAIEYRITDDYLCELIKNLPTGSINKQIPQWVIDLPKEQLEIFYRGYFSGDGHSRKDRDLEMFCTVSKELYLALQEIIIKLYNVVPTVSIRHDNRKDTFNDTYNAQYSFNPKNQKVINDQICVPIKEITRETKEIEVFNFEVEKDNSYTVNNVIVHNCQDISIAGKQRGFTDEDGQQTRSGLFFEALRIITDLQPQYAIAENVKALTSNAFNDEFETVIKSLADAGYNNYYSVLNAKDYGIPQNRERIFIVSIRKDLDTHEFTFPDKLPLTKTLKDLLEPKVDEKYYINNERAKNLIEQIKSRYIITESTPVDGTILEPRAKEVCNCITARYDAGIQNQKSIGCMVVEPKVNNVGSTNGHQSGNVYDTDGLSPTICVGTHVAPQMIVEKKQQDPIVIGSMQEHTAIKNDGVCPCLTTAMGTSGGNTPMIVEDDARIKYIGSYGSGERRKVYDPNGLSPCLNASDYKGATNIIQVGNLMPEAKFKNTQRGRVYDPEGLAPTLNTVSGGSLEPKIIEVPCAIASRGRNPDNPSDRTTGSPTEQRLEPNTTNCANTLTTVQKDNYILEPKVIDDTVGFYDEPKIYEETVPTLRAERYGLKVTECNPELRIRKLTPKECFRLMGFSDEDFDSIKGISNAQLYKMAGNSIVVNVLEEIFKSLFFRSFYW